MKRPNLINPQNWTPFRSIPNIPKIVNEITPPINIPVVPAPVPKYILKREIFQRNSFYLNFFSFLIIIGLAYFLYSIYLERKIFSDYLEFVKNTEEEKNILPQFYN